MEFIAVPKELGTLFEDESGQFYETRFDATRFAAWLKTGYENSRFKTIKALADAVFSNPATISRLMNAAPQWTGKPSKPKFSLVTALSEQLAIDIAEGMAAAGYAYLDTDHKIPKDILVLFHDAENWSERKRKAIAEMIQKDIDFYDSVISTDEGKNVK